MNETLTKTIKAVNEPIKSYKPGSPEKESVKKETTSDEKKTDVSKVKKQTSDKKLEAENKPKK